MVQNRRMALLLERKVESWRSTEAKPCCANARYTFCLQPLQDLVDGIHPAIGAVFSNPCVAIEVGVVEVDDGVAIEDIGDNGPKTVVGESVGQ